MLFKACFVVDRVGMGYRSTLRLLVSGSTPRIFAKGGGWPMQSSPTVVNSKQYCDFLSYVHRNSSQSKDFALNRNC